MLAASTPRTSRIGSTIGSKGVVREPQQSRGHTWDLDGKGIPKHHEGKGRNNAANERAQELGSHTPMTDDSWASSLYLETAKPAHIELFLRNSGEYENGRWTRVPQTPSAPSDLKEPLCKLINSILDSLLPSRKGAARVAIDAQAHHP